MTNLPFWTDQMSILLTSFWGYTPDTWGTVSFTSEARRNNLLKTLSDPFITVIYVTSNRSHIDSNLKNMVAGFYLVSHETGHRDEFTHPLHHGRNPDSWRYGLRALRAFAYLPEYRISMDELDPSMKLEKRFRAVATYGELLKDKSEINRLRSIPVEEVDVYEPLDSLKFPSVINAGGNAGPGYVQGGPERRSGYYVPDQDVTLPRSLYILLLQGDTSAFLGEPASNRSIYKIGLAVSPELRRQSFQKAMPDGAFRWKLHKSTIQDSRQPYPSFGAAKHGEFQMKLFLTTKGKWLGGEFYAASDEVISEAWRIGRDAALSKIAGK